MSTGPVRIGVLGTARVIESVLLANAADTPEIQVVAVASRDAGTAASYAARHGIARSWGRYEDLLADDDVEMVYNALPNSLHAEWSIAALRAGKGVLCEKPMASNAAQARAMIAVSEATGLALIEGLHYRYHPLMRHVRNLLDGGGLGTLRTIEVRLNIAGHHFSDDDIRFDHALAGGTLMDLGPYCIDMLRLLSGAEPEALTATASLKAPEVDGAMTGKMRLGTADAHFECSLQNETSELALIVRGDRGTLRVDNPMAPQWGHSLALEIDGQSEVCSFELTPSYVFQARHVAAVMRGGVAVETDVYNALANMTAIDAVYRAAGMTPRQ